MFYALAENEKFLHPKVNLFVALAPIVRFKYADEFIGKATVTFDYVFDNAIGELGIYYLFGLQLFQKMNPFSQSNIAHLFMDWIGVHLFGDSKYNNQEW
jgi:hypothetical protein